MAGATQSTGSAAAVYYGEQTYSSVLTMGDKDCILNGTKVTDTIQTFASSIKATDVTCGGNIRSARSLELKRSVAIGNIAATDKITAEDCRIGSIKTLGPIFVKKTIVDGEIFSGEYPIKIESSILNGSVSSLVNISLTEGTRAIKVKSVAGKVSLKGSSAKEITGNTIILSSSAAESAQATKALFGLNCSSLNHVSSKGALSLKNCLKVSKVSGFNGKVKLQNSTVSIVVLNDQATLHAKDSKIAILMIYSKRVDEAATTAFAMQERNKATAILSNTSIGTIKFADNEGTVHLDGASKLTRKVINGVQKNQIITGSITSAE